jgi:DNA-binding GntR family transcriptional regulator
MSAADPITQERVYRAVRNDYLAGLFFPGARLDLQALADRHRASKTPVREAVHRLMGERLVEPNPDGGFRIIDLPPARLLELHAWNGHVMMSLIPLIRQSLLRNTLDRLSRIRVPQDPVGIALHTGAIFVALAEASANTEAVAAIVQVNDRLFYPRIIGSRQVDACIRELTTFTNSAVSDLHKSVRRRLEAYHLRRIEQSRRLMQDEESTR